MTEDLPAPSGPRKTRLRPPSGQQQRLILPATPYHQLPSTRQGLLSVARLRSSARSLLRRRRTGSQFPELAAERISAVLPAPQKRATCCRQPAASCRYRLLSLLACPLSRHPFAIFLTR